LAELNDNAPEKAKKVEEYEEDEDGIKVKVTSNVEGKTFYQ